MFKQIKTEIRVLAFTTRKIIAVFFLGMVYFSNVTAKSFCKIFSSPINLQNFGYELAVTPSEHVRVGTVDKQSTPKVQFTTELPLPQTQKRDVQPDTP